jgi:hypothetical protein
MHLGAERLRGHPGDDCARGVASISSGRRELEVLRRCGLLIWASETRADVIITDHHAPSHGPKIFDGWMLRLSPQSHDTGFQSALRPQLTIISNWRSLLPLCTAYAVPGADEPPASFRYPAWFRFPLQSRPSFSEVCDWPAYLAGLSAPVEPAMPWRRERPPRFIFLIIDSYIYVRLAACTHIFTRIWGTDGTGQWRTVAIEDGE